ncbi:50S ribosomal protein L19 [Patescibacteria group bacterium]
MADEPTKQESQENKEEKKALPEFRVGDTVKVFYKIIEGKNERIQPFEGIVISKKGKDMSKTFTVRRIGADKVGVERIFPLFSPNIVDLKVMRKGKVRRAKLYYLRGKIGREATKVKERK